MASTFTLNFSGLFGTSSQGIYSNFSNRYVAFTFKKPADIDIISIAGVLESDIFVFDPALNIIIPYTPTPTIPIYNWQSFLPYNTGGFILPYGGIAWNIPLTGASKWVGKFVFNAETYYTIFALINSEGNIVNNNGAGTAFDVVISTSDLDIIFHQVKLEALPSMTSLSGATIVPCDTVINLYGGTGDLEVFLE